MRGIVKGLYSPDIADLWAFIPEEQECFGFLLQIIVGPDGEEGEESFDVTVATPVWFTRHHRVDAILIGRHYLIVFEYDFPRIAAFISAYVARCTGKDWNEVARKLSRLGHWEFEDYESNAS